MKRFVCFILTIDEIGEDSQKLYQKFTFKAKWHESDHRNIELPYCKKF